MLSCGGRSTKASARAPADPVAAPGTARYPRRMTKTIVVAGFGPGISTAVAERFGKAGFQVALVARNAERLAAGVKALEGKGIRAQAFPADLGDPSKAQAVVGQVRKALGPIDTIVWTAYSGAAGDALAADATEVRAALEIATGSLLAAVREALPDLRARKGSVLVTNGGYGLFDPQIDAMGAQGAMGLSMANSAKHKLVGMLAQKLRGDDVYVGEVMVLGMVKGSAFDQGNANIEAADVAEKFWTLSTARTETFTQIA